METLMTSTADQLRQEGRREGETTGRADVLVRLLTRRFGPLPTGVETRVRSATIPDLDRWADNVLTAGTLDEVFATDAP
jgi:Domain of unknown function (DUF4351)